jgi:hypothetical protein
VKVSQHRLIFAHQFAFYFLEHLLVAGAGALHFILVLLQDETDFIVDAIFQLKLFQQGVIQRR